MRFKEQPKEKVEWGIDLDSAEEVVIVNNTISSADEVDESSEPLEYDRNKPSQQ